MKLSPFVFAAIILGACGTTLSYSQLDAQADAPKLTDNRRVYMLSELERQRALWKSRTPQEYTYLISNSCFCFPSPARGPNEIQVENDNIVRRIYRGKIIDGYVSDSELHEGLGIDASINDLFDIIEGHLKPKADNYFGSDVKVNFTVKYDVIRGFPHEISFDAEQVLDEQYTITVSNFEPH